jgi:hypothetical protein
MEGMEKERRQIMSQSKDNLLTGQEIVPKNLRDRGVERFAPRDPRLQKIIAKANAALEGNVREFLEKWCDVKGAMDLSTPMEDIRMRMKLNDIAVCHMQVKMKPELDGVWIIKGDQPLVCFTDPIYRNKKVVINRIILHAGTAARALEPGGTA